MTDAATMSLSTLGLEQTLAFNAADWNQTIPDSYSRETLRNQEEEYYLSKALGAHGMTRVREFQLYPDAWGDGSCRAYSPAAFRCLLEFLKAFAFPASSFPPSVFFSQDGGFEIEWESYNQKSVQVEFKPDGIEVYHEDKDLDLELEPQQLDELFELLS